MADSATGTVGAILRDARERRGMSLRQIANATKISVSALEALERNDISKLPGGIFTRAFVRSYAIQVGLDPEQTIREFMGQFPHESVTAGHPATVEVEDNETFESNRRMATVFVKLIASSVAAAGVVFYLTSFRQSSLRQETPRPAAVQQAPHVPESAATEEPSAPPEQTPNDAVPSANEAVETPAVQSVPAAVGTAGRLTVAISARDRCWVSVVVDGQSALQRELAPGETHTFEVRDDVVLTVGNAAALTITLNGAEARPLGGPGQVVTTRLTAENFKTYLVNP